MKVFLLGVIVLNSRGWSGSNQGWSHPRKTPQHGNNLIDQHQQKICKKHLQAKIEEANLIRRDELTVEDCLQPGEIILLMLQTDLFCWQTSRKGGDVEEISFKSWSLQVWRGDAWWDIWELDSQDGNDDKQDNFENAAKEGLGKESSIMTAMVRQSQPLHFFTSSLSWSTKFVWTWWISLFHYIVNSLSAQKMSSPSPSPGMTEQLHCQAAQQTQFIWDPDVWN